MTRFLKFADFKSATPVGSNQASAKNNVDAVKKRKWLTPAEEDALFAEIYGKMNYRLVSRT
ncbi:hypothetical protein GCM10008927_00260 [Amylibacter ulvae]|uniref:Uncharacterized protein n=1 Tax=Paramylibacter ulvae TaxID=1651968 RepID=A0ABQ3CSN9_9RHOB|nr:hypothetical protein [Amylibacter ulvae]GHA40131.1 hypothetical protein GCM10008927_00260 [Amylibacter ulvae]